MKMRQIWNLSLVTLFYCKFAFAHSVNEVKSFELIDWNSSCRVSGSYCWLDAINDSGFDISAFQVELTEAGTGVITTKKIYQVCQDDTQVTTKIPKEIQQGWSSGWIDNACLNKGGLVKITMRAGINAAFSDFDATVVYSAY